MKIRNPEGLYIVITGDIVGSSRLSSKERKKLLEVMTAGSKEVCKAFKGAVPLEVDIFRGDSWQLLVTAPMLGLHVPLFYRGFIKAKMTPARVDTRLAIALGTIDLVPETRVSQGDGQAYRLSGRAMEVLKGYNRMVFVFPDELKSAITQAIRALVFLTDVLVTKWTPKQAEAITGVLKGMNQEEIAATWPDGPVSQQAVAQHLLRAGWYGLSKGLDFVKEGMVDLQDPSKNKV